MVTPMNDSRQGQRCDTGGYGHDAKGAAGGAPRSTASRRRAHRAVDKVSGEGAGAETVTFTLDGEEVEAREGETIWQVAKRQGTDIPHLCYAPEPGYRPDGNCRACMVEIEGERVLAASCIRTPTAGMKVKSASDRAKTARKMVFELLISDQPDRNTQAHDPASKFWNWADRIGIASSRLPSREHRPAPDRSHVAMAVNLDAAGRIRRDNRKPAVTCGNLAVSRVLRAGRSAASRGEPFRTLQ